MGLKINGIPVAGLGLPGKSAYEQAKQGGYTGTEEEFNTLLAGLDDMQNDISNIGDRVDNLTYVDVGAAPAGFGLGESLTLITAAELETLKKPGWYMYSDVEPIGGANSLALIECKGNNGSVTGFTAQEAIVNLSSGPHKLIRRCTNSGWLPWEWVNPPMEPDKEYRTTERYLGKPVYATLVDFGALPNATTKTVAHGIKNFLNGVSTQVRLSTGADATNWFGITSFLATASDASITTNGDQSAFSAIMKIKYTKTTD